MNLITVSSKAGFEASVHVREHSVVSDMSPEDGGRDAGPSPAELFAASLGACVAMMVHRYCEAHGYPGETSVYVTPELADHPKRIGSIVMDVELPDSVPEDRRDVVRRVAEKCLVHETLRHPPDVDIDIV